MAAVVFTQRSPELDAILERRRALGLDGHDEVHDGVYVVNPAPRPGHARIVADVIVALVPRCRDAGLACGDSTNVGELDDYRVPDVTVWMPEDEGESAFLPTAELVVEVVSPGEDRTAKLGFYADRGVPEVLTLEPDQRRGTLWQRSGDRWVDAQSSQVIDLSLADLTDIW